MTLAIFRSSEKIPVSKLRLIEVRIKERVRGTHSKTCLGILQLPVLLEWSKRLKVLIISSSVTGLKKKDEGFVVQ